MEFIQRILRKFFQFLQEFFWQLLRKFFQKLLQEFLREILRELIQNFIQKFCQGFFQKLFEVLFVNSSRSFLGFCSWSCFRIVSCSNFGNSPRFSSGNYQFFRKTIPEILPWALPPLQAYHIPMGSLNIENSWEHWEDIENSYKMLNMLFWTNFGFPKKSLENSNCLWRNYWKEFWKNS